MDKSNDSHKNSDSSYNSSNNMNVNNTNLSDVEDLDSEHSEIDQNIINNEETVNDEDLDSDHYYEEIDPAIFNDSNLNNTNQSEDEEADSDSLDNEDSTSNDQSLVDNLDLDSEDRKLDVVYPSKNGDLDSDDVEINKTVSNDSNLNNTNQLDEEAHSDNIDLDGARSNDQNQADITDLEQTLPTQISKVEESLSKTKEFNLDYEEIEEMGLKDSNLNNTNILEKDLETSDKLVDCKNASEDFQPDKHSITQTDLNSEKSKETILNNEEQINRSNSINTAVTKNNENFDDRVYDDEDMLSDSIDSIEEYPIDNPYEVINWQLDPLLYKSIVQLENEEDEFYENKKDTIDYRLAENILVKVKYFKDNIKVKTIQNDRVYVIKINSNPSKSRDLMKFKSELIQRIHFIFPNDESRYFLKDYVIMDLSELQDHLIPEKLKPVIFKTIFTKDDFSTIYQTINNSHKNMNYELIVKNILTALVDVILYFHQRKVLMVNLNLKSIGFTNKGNLKVNIDDMFDDSNLHLKDILKDPHFPTEYKYGYATDYLSLGNLMLQLYVPGFEILDIINLPYDEFINANMISDHFERPMEYWPSSWHNYFSFNSHLVEIREILTDKITDCNIRQFIASCFFFWTVRCEGYIREINVRRFDSFTRQRILSKQLLIENNVIDDIENCGKIIDIESNFQDIIENDAKTYISI